MSSQVKAIPSGYHSVTPVLIVQDGAAAIDFYRAAFNAKEVFRTNSPDGRVMHAEITIGDSRLMLMEEAPDRGWYSPISLRGNSISLYVYVENVDALFNQAIAAGAGELRPLADAFWGDRTGEVSDPFGHRWSLATHKEDLRPEQLAERAEAFYMSTRR